MLLLIDNYDSFTHNLAHYFAELGQQVKVCRNDELTLADIEIMAPQYIVLSPGPGTPDDAGISLALIQQFAGKIPILGVCLGYQAIGQVFGASVVRASKVLHGKTSQVEHVGSLLFSGVDNPFTATRYHSLIIDAKTLPEDFKVTAVCKNSQGEVEAIMAIEHQHWPLCGVQFHPESVLTTAGHQILRNFLNMK
ncbi:aminodeoxychorismate/anthranilate synthase component II [Alteromonadaceae bacterium BrNp21-10]|nr:aminodeoxychorismate/anthranilate synthase component II [Alteromonadaceae bacterium BrNp21-10]